MATHIVGGDFFYTRINANRYEITLKLYIDCINGEPDAISSDKEAIVGIFNGRTNAYVDRFTMTRTGPNRVSKINYTCVIPPQDVCVDEYVYKYYLNINPGTDGLILAFQRCCRNRTIDNLFDAEGTGATYWIKIPGTSTVSNNSAARFKNLPPNFLCTDEQLIFDHSATDPDGDSLVYELYQPYTGANRTTPRPTVPSTPPFKKVTYLTGYTRVNQMNGNPPLRIDRKTGILTVTPEKVGQFVIGVKVMEFRNGKMIGETLRDYQFNVKKCTPIIESAFFNPTYFCSDTVNFTNKSRGAKQYIWTISDPTRDVPFETNETNPTYIFPGNGDYKVKLVANDLPCTDTFSTYIHVKSKIDVDLGPDKVLCEEIDETLKAPYFDATRIAWSTGQFGIQINVKKLGTYTAKVYYGTCFGEGDVTLSSAKIGIHMSPDSLYCDKVNGFIDAGVDDVHYQWNTTIFDTSRTLQVSKPGLYSVTVWNDYCQESDSILLFTHHKPEIGPYYFVCNEFQKELDAGENRGATYLWDNGSTSRYRTINSQGTYWVKVNQRQCSSSDTLVVKNPVIPLDLGHDTIYCDSFRRVLIAPEGPYEYVWSTESSAGSIEVNKEGYYILEVWDTNGCVNTDTIFLGITPSPVIDLGSDTGICLRSGINIGPRPEFVKYEWNTGESSESIWAEDEGVYKVTVTDKYKCEGSDSIRVYFDPDALPNDLYIPNAFTPNGDRINEFFPFSEEITQREFSVRVYNRWGQKVFDSELEGTVHWDGTFRDHRATEDAYVYIIQFRGCDGNLYYKRGTVTILR